MPRPRTKQMHLTRSELLLLHRLLGVSHPAAVYNKIFGTNYKINGEEVENGGLPANTLSSIRSVMEGVYYKAERALYRDKDRAAEIIEVAKEELRKAVGGPKTV